MKKIRILSKRSILTGFLVMVIAFVLLTIAWTPGGDSRRPAFDSRFKMSVSKASQVAIACCDIRNAFLQDGDSAAIQAGRSICSEITYYGEEGEYDNNLENVIVSSNCNSKKWELIITPAPNQTGRCTKAVCGELGCKYTKADGTAC